MVNVFTLGVPEKNITGCQFKSERLLTPYPHIRIEFDDNFNSTIFHFIEFLNFLKQDLLRSYGRFGGREGSDTGSEQRKARIRKTWVSSDALIGFLQLNPQASSSLGRVGGRPEHSRALAGFRLPASPQVSPLPLYVHIHGHPC